MVKNEFEPCDTLSKIYILFVQRRLEKELFQQILKRCMVKCFCNKSEFNLQVTIIVKRKQGMKTYTVARRPFQKTCFFWLPKKLEKHERLNWTSRTREPRTRDPTYGRVIRHLGSWPLLAGVF